MANDTAPPLKRQVRKRIWIPSVLLGIVVLTVAWLVWRGTSADTIERNPASAAEGAVTQLLTQEGRTLVRSAIIVPAAPADVWKVVTDYDSHPKFIRYVSEMTSQKRDDGRVRLSGVLHSRLWGDFPFRNDVTHVENAEKREYAATWNEERRAGAGFRVDSGGWTVKSAPGDQTLLTFTLQMEVEGYPNFLVRNILMDRVGAIVQTMRDEVAKRGRG